MVQLVWRHSCIAARLPVVVRLSADPRASLKTVDPPKGNGLGPKKCWDANPAMSPMLVGFTGSICWWSVAEDLYIHIISFRTTLMDLGYLGSRNYCIFYTMQPTNRMQSRRTLLRNKLFEPSTFPLSPYQCTVDCGMRKRVECKVRSVRQV